MLDKELRLDELRLDELRLDRELRLDELDGELRLDELRLDRELRLDEELKPRLERELL